MIIGPLMEIINNTSFIAMRSIISKLVLPEELGTYLIDFIEIINYKTELFQAKLIRFSVFVKL